jgi:glycosyltransferase involved in cell wall biosynthesis
MALPGAARATAFLDRSEARGQEERPVSQRPCVVHVVRKWNLQEWGGTETHVAAVTAALEGRGWISEVHAPSLATGDEAGSGLAPTVTLRRFAAHNPYVAGPTRRAALRATGGNLFTLDEPVRLLRDRRAAVAHLHTGGRIGGAVRLAMRWTGRPYVLSAHGPLLADPALVANETAHRVGAAWDAGRPIGALVGARRVLDDAAAVLCFNEDERRALEVRVGARAIRMDHGVDVARLAGGDAARADERWPALRGQRVVLVLGRLSRQKNQRLAVEAFAAGAPRDAVLVLAGAETDPGYRDEVLALARALGVGARVHSLGNVAPAVVPDLIARAEVALVPSTHEAFGLVVIEAWAAGVPTLFAGCVGLRDLAEPLADARACVRSERAEAWAEALRGVCADPAWRASLAAEGRALVARRFRWDAVADRLAGVYESALAAGRRRAA